MQCCWSGLTLAAGTAVASCRQTDSQDLCSEFITETVETQRIILNRILLKSCLMGSANQERAVTVEHAVCVTCTADSGADPLRQKGAVGLFDWLRAANQIQPSCGSCPGEPHETGHSRREVTHFHGLEKKRANVTDQSGSELVLHLFTLSTEGECVFAPRYLNGDPSGRYDLLHSNRRPLGQGHLPVGGLLRSSTERQLSAGASGVAKRSGR